MITLYGFGYVGQAVHDFLSGRYRVQITDPRLGMRGDIDLEYAIICVPTLEREDGSCDTSVVEQVIRDTNHKHYLVKSTVPPGTCARLAKTYGKSITFSPEYIGEGKYEVPWWTGIPHPQDMTKHTFHIFGGDPAVTPKWVRLWQSVAGWVASYHETDSTTAEMVKYAENMFMATKKLFCSELFLTAQAFGVEYTRLRELWLQDARVGVSMTLVWPEKLAFDGKCLPKDTAALCEAAKLAGHDPKLFRAVVERNKELAKK